jgi:hypothetical protein
MIRLRLISAYQHFEGPRGVFYTFSKSPLFVAEIETNQPQTNLFCIIVC